MPNSKYKCLIEKSIAAAISAIEIYNKPDFKYREENFAILMINAWELLLKAKILKDTWDFNSILIPKKTETKKGRKLKRFYPKLSRTKNPMTISIIDAFKKVKIDKVLEENITLLLDIRDSSVHYLNKDSSLDKKILEIWTANLKSYVTCCNEWFKYDLSKYNFFLMPISFFHTFEIKSFSVTSKDKQIEALKRHIVSKEQLHPSDEWNKHNISLILETNFKKSSWESILWYKYDEKNGIPVKMDAEEAFKKRYQFDYNQVVAKVRKKYPYNFKQNREFNKIMSTLKWKEEFHWVRYLNFDNKTWAKKEYYSWEALKKIYEIYDKKVSLKD